jgi:hypothetical protein
MLLVYKYKGMKLIRPIYSGYIRLKNGKLIKSEHYEPIVSLELYKKAADELKKHL